MRALYVEISIRTDLDEIWQRTQAPDQHQRWDLRFTRITGDDAPRRFRYSVRVLPGVWLHGRGVCVGERHHPDGTWISALRFAPDTPLSPLGAGAGYWRYVPDRGGVRFITGYDYRPAWGAWADLVVRPLMSWATAWSFDRLRLWLERGISPEASRRHALADLAVRVLVVTAVMLIGPVPLAAMVGLAAGLLPPGPTTPAARRCRRRPRRPTTQPSIMDTVEIP